MAIRKIKLPGEQQPRDIGANSSNIIYDGDQGVTTTLNNKIQSIFTAIGDINSFEIALVNALPTENIDDHTIYFVPNSQDANTRDEYMYVDNQWELIGSTTIDLSDYPTYDDITVTQGLTTGIPAATITVGATTTTIYSADANALTPTLDDRYVNVTGDTMSGSLTINQQNSVNDNNLILNYYTTYSQTSSITPSIAFKPSTMNSESAVLRVQGNTKDSSVLNKDIYISGVTTPNYPQSTYDKYVASKGYVDSKISSVTSTIPTITATQALTTGITIGSIDVSGITTTFYAPEAVTPPAYSLSMSGATITLLADNVAASTITLPIYDGTVI